MKYINPIIKVEWEDTPENMTQEKLRRVKDYFKHKYNTTNVKVVPKSTAYNSTTKLRSLDVSDNIMDHQYQKKLIKDFIKENNIEVKWDLIDRLDNKVNAEIDSINENRVKYNKWSLNKIEFSNFMSYGDDNTIDFSEFNGITVIESNPKNFGGKCIRSNSIIEIEYNLDFIYKKLGFIPDELK